MLLFETILIDNGEISNLKYHNSRLNWTQRELFGMDSHIDLSLYLRDIPQNGKYRCKVIYSKNIEDIEIKPYRYKERKKYIALEIDFDYRYKYLNRESIESLQKQFSNFDDIIFIKNSLITDTTIANIAIYKDGRWLTPAKPLLRGTTRARLLDEGKLDLVDIKYRDLLDADKFAIMNALSGFRVINSPLIVSYRDISDTITNR